MPIYPTNAPALSKAERSEIIEPVCSEDPIAFECATAKGPGRFDGESDRELAYALERASGGGMADQYAGDSSTGGYGARFGRMVLVTDAQGFLTVEVFADAEEAERQCDALDADTDDD